MMKPFVHHIDKEPLWLKMLRLITGAVFVFSGAVKLIDPLGTVIKLGDYFAPDVLNLAFLMPYREYLAFALIITELWVGLAILLRYRPRITFMVSLLLTGFFLFLTAYTLYTGKVTDCGCFGDAVKLTPMQTFIKNIILMGALLVLYRFYGNAPDPRPMPKAMILALSSIVFLAFGIWTRHHLPLIDFRPYAVGKNIRKGMEIPPDAPRFKFRDIWYYRINGKVRKFTSEEAPWDIPGAEFVRRESQVVQRGYVPPIHDFSIENDSIEITDSILDSDDIYLILIPYPGKLDARDTLRLGEVLKRLKRNGRPYVIVSADKGRLLDQWIWNNKQELYFMDPTALKTAIRTRVGIMHLKNANIISKETLKDFLDNRKI